MNLRTLKRRTLVRLTNQRWSYITCTPSEDNPKMYPIRHIKPCRTYSVWCADCNAVRFRRDFGRFPFNMVEFDDFEDAVQTEYTKAHPETYDAEGFRIPTPVSQPL